ncbi:ABC transporter permease [Actinoplanes sp. NPDC020271]|uniref:ABC transporter permease n=1 Tax=Actinoplanes sp. NPDC020271 TaxID=3363896 RepID=UPI00379BB1B8
MIGLAVQTLRARRAGFAGVFVALALGAGLLTVTGLAIAATIGHDREPVWFSGATLVAVPTDTVTVRIGSGDGAFDTSNSVGARPGVPAEAVTRLSTLPGAVVDRRIPAMIGDMAADVHPWASATLHPASLTAGRPPAADGEAVVTVASGRQVGELFDVRTADATHTWKVTGVVTGPAAVYVTDASAAALAGGRVDAVAFRDGGAAEAVRESGLQVLTGDRRALAEPDPDRDAMADTIALLGTFSGLAVLVSIFVVAGTFAFAVSQRRREMALLRAAGATPRQVRRLVLGEAALASLLASAAGCALGTVLAPWCGRWLVAHGLAPAGFTVAFNGWAVLSAAGAGLLIAMIGTWAAARRAGKVRPIEALRDATADRRVMTVPRWIFGVLFAAGAIAMVAAGGSVTGEDAIALTFFSSYLALIAVVLLTPLLAPLLIRVLTGALPGVTVQIARSNALTAVRRTASTATPVLLTVGLAATILSATSTAQRAAQTASRARITASTLVSAVDSLGVPASAVDALSRVPGVSAAVPVRSASAFMPTGDSVELITADYVGAGIEQVWKLPAEVRELRAPGTVVISADLADDRGWHVGDEIQLWEGDTTPLRCRVVAVLPPSLDLSLTVLLPYPSAVASSRSSAVGPSPGGSSPVGPSLDGSSPVGPSLDGPSLVGADVVYLAGTGDAEALRAAVGSAGEIATPDAYFAAQAVAADRMNHLVMLALLGMTLLYSAIAIANTLVMSTADRARDIAVLRLGGATPRQVLGLIAAETGTVVAVALLLAAVVTAAMLGGLRSRLSDLVSTAEIVAPWSLIALITVLCVSVAFAASLIPAALLLRTPPSALAALRD